VNLTRRGKRSWRLKYDLPSDADGRRQTRYVTLRGTFAQAKAEALRILASVSAGMHVDPSTETVGRFKKRWLEARKPDIANQKWRHYEILLRNQVIPRVGNVPIQRLRAVDVQEIYAAIAREGLSAGTRLQVHRALHVMLKSATQWNVVARNVADLVDKPRLPDTEVGVLSAEQIQAALAALDEPLHTIAAVLLGTGLRRGEVLALRWQDVDLDGATLRVERALEDAGEQFKAPKNRFSRRTVTLPAAVVTTLRVHRVMMQEQAIALGRGRLRPEALVFADFEGRPLRPQGVTRRLDGGDEGGRPHCHAA
jgi:integrase